MSADQVESVFPRLEALLPLVQKPIQYVGGELNAVSKDWESTTVRWALMYPDAYEVGVPNQGVQILYEVLNEQPDVLAERTYSVWPDLEALMREHGVPQFTVDAHRPVGAFDVFGPLVLHRARLHQHAHRPRPRRHPAARRATAPTPTRSCWPAATPPSTPSRSPTSSTPRCSATASRRRWRSPTWSATSRPRVLPVAASSCSCGSPRPAASTSRGSTTSSTCRTAGSSGSSPTALACRGGSASTPSSTSTRGPTRRSRSCRWPRACTSGRASRSSAAAPVAAGSARPA